LKLSAVVLAFAAAITAVLAVAAASLVSASRRNPGGGKPAHTAAATSRPTSSPTARATPTSTAGGRISGPRDLPVPLLTFHHIGVPPNPNGIDRFFYDPPAIFAAQVKYFVDRGYTAVTLQQVYDFWHGKGTLPRRPVIFSFDDGYRSAFQVAAPILHKLGWPGVLNLITRNVGPSSELTPQMVRTMISWGWEIDSHTIHHPNLTTLNGARLMEELSGSRRILQQAFHVPVNFLCFPGGSYNASTLAAVRQAGYLGAMTTHSGYALPSEIYELHRIAMNSQRVGKHLEATLRQSLLYPH
jgi:peptidoglycan/xylan/chitin deacetylase (PgdA/CDA1 family)